MCLLESANPIRHINFLQRNLIILQKALNVTRTHAKTEEHAMIILTLTPALVLLDSLELTVKQVLFSIVNLISEKYIINPCLKSFYEYINKFSKFKLQKLRHQIQVSTIRYIP